MITSTITGQQIAIEMAATPENIDIADDLVHEFLENFECGTHLFACRMMLRESLMNAVIHGCDSNPGLSISVVARVTDYQVYELVIDDPGPGFMHASDVFVPDSEQTHGRGRVIMYKLSDSVEYNDLGNHIKLTKRLNVEACEKQEH